MLHGQHAGRRAHVDLGDRRLLGNQSDGGATPKVEALATPIFGPMAEESYRLMATYTDAELELISGFTRASRELLKCYSSPHLRLMEQGKKPRQ
jgi:hypothetical protein